MSLVVRCLSIHHSLASNVVFDEYLQTTRSHYYRGISVKYRTSVLPSVVCSASRWDAAHGRGGIVTNMSLADYRQYGAPVMSIDSRGNFSKTLDGVLVCRNRIVLKSDTDCHFYNCLLYGSLLGSHLYYRYGHSCYPVTFLDEPKRHPREGAKGTPPAPLLR
jgi:hypothetical protein